MNNDNIITAQDINEALDELIADGSIISKKASASYPQLEEIFKKAENVRSIGGRLMLVGDLLRYAVERLPEGEQKIAQEIMHLIGVEPTILEEYDQDGPDDIDANTDPYTGQADYDPFPIE